MRGRPNRYTDAQMAWLEANHALSLGAYHAGFVAAFGRDDVTSVALNSLRKRMNWRTGRTGRFVKGATPANKGKACAPGEGGLHPNAVATQFKKGARSGVAARLYKPIGSERVTREGYHERKVNDDFPMQSRWKAVHRINWEAVHGPLPAGMFLKCLDGDKGNTDPANWQALPRGAQPFLNGHRGFDYEAAHPGVRPAIIAVARLRVASKEAGK